MVYAVDGVGSDGFAMRVGDNTSTKGPRQTPHRLCATAACVSAAFVCAIAASAALADGIVPAGGGADSNAGQQSPQVAATPAPAASAAAAQMQASPGSFPAQQPPVERPGFIYAFGRWWDGTRARLDALAEPPDSVANSAAQATQNAMKGAAEATKNAMDALLHLPSSRFIEVHERCAAAPNGAPDCRTAAAKVCRVKGFDGGHAVDVQSSEKCPPAVWISGRRPVAGQCPQETVILMVACN